MQLLLSVYIKIPAMLNYASFAHYYTLHIYLQAFVGMGMQLPENIRRISIH